MHTGETRKRRWFAGSVLVTATALLVGPLTGVGTAGAEDGRPGPGSLSGAPVGTVGTVGTVAADGSATGVPATVPDAPLDLPAEQAAIRFDDTSETGSLGRGALPRRYRVRKWPRGRITYYDASRSSRSVRAAARIWNRSGPAIKFSQVKKRSRASLLIRNTRKGVPSGCGSGRATLGYAGPRHQEIMNLLAGTAEDGQACSVPGQTLIALHEFGHVLGLRHVKSGCSLMNPMHYFGVAPMGCVTTSEERVPGRWWCRGPEKRDVRAVRKMYGGRVKAVRADPWCDLYTPLGAPTAYQGADEYGRPTLETVRPTDPAMPDYLSAYATARGHDSRGVATHVAPGPCTPVAYAREGLTTYYGWAVPEGGVQRQWLQELQLPPGEHCATVWAVDLVGRPSGTPTQVPLSIPG